MGCKYMGSGWERGYLGKGRKWTRKKVDMENKRFCGSRGKGTTGMEGEHSGESLTSEPWDVRGGEEWEVNE